MGRRRYRPETSALGIHDFQNGNGNEKKNGKRKHDLQNGNRKKTAAGVKTKTKTGTVINGKNPVKMKTVTGMKLKVPGGSSGNNINRFVTHACKLNMNTQANTDMNINGRVSGSMEPGNRTDRKSMK
jgi:hypothetical protein